ncbi:MAG: repeat protein [Bacteroidota bacterium]|nr:repeat protein [Bacteroidota bacterium]
MRVKVKLRQLMKIRFIFLLLTIIAFFNGINAQTPGDSAPPVRKSPIKSRDMELQRDRLLLIDATVELNDALLQGINASLDSLNGADNNTTDDKNIQVTVRKMQRSRDKALLTPELLHMQDSLKNENATLKKQKAEIETSLAELRTQAKQNEIASAQTKKEPAVPVKENTKANETKEEPLVKKEDKRHKKHEIPNDTLIVINADPVKKDSEPVASADTKSKKKDKNKHPVTEQPVAVVAAARDSVLSPLISEAPVYSQAVALPEDTSLLSLKDSEQQFFDDSINRVRAEYFLTRARKYINEKNYKAAKENLQKALGMQPVYYDARLALADVNSTTGDNVQALENYKICQKIDSSSEKLYYKMGVAALILKQKTEALRYFEKSLKIDSNYIPSIMARATFLTDDGRYIEAIAAYNHVLTLNVGFHLAYKSRGLARFNAKEYSAAVDDLSRYLLFKEDDPSIYYFRGIARENIDQQSAGCLDLTTASQLGYSLAQKAIEKYCSKN